MIDMNEILIGVTLKFGVYFTLSSLLIIAIGELEISRTFTILVRFAGCIFFLVGLFLIIKGIVGL